MSYTWSYVSVLLYRRDYGPAFEPKTFFQSVGHHTKALNLLNLLDSLV